LEALGSSAKAEVAWVIVCFPGSQGQD
jgi:hypothetical protein